MAESTSKFFADTKFENLDWISQAVEPWEWPIIEQISAIPTETPITPEFILKTMRSAYLELDLRSAIRTVGRVNFDDLSWEAGQTVRKMFKFEVPDGTTFDGTTLTYSNPVVLRKLKPTLDQTEILSAASESITNYINQHLSMDKNATEAQSRAAQILDLLGVSPGECRGHKQKRRALVSTLRTNILEDKYRIRSMALVQKLGLWVCNYIDFGNLASMANFAKFKVMTHSGNPIYSIQEVE